MQASEPIEHDNTSNFMVQELLFQRGDEKKL